MFTAGFSTGRTQDSSDNARGGVDTSTRKLKVWVGVFLAVLVVSAGLAIVALERPGAKVSGPDVRAQAASISYEFYDFFNVEFGQFWDYRTAVYGDLPLNAECFNRTSATIRDPIFDEPICAGTNQAVADTPTYPYTNWYPSPLPAGRFTPSDPQTNSLIYAPYRFRVQATAVPGYDRTTPVFLPVFNPSAPAGTRLDFSWELDYIDYYEATALGLCGFDANALDGFQTESWINLTMDLQESRRIFGVVGNTATEARSWWSSSITGVRPGCFAKGGLEVKYDTHMIAQGGSISEYGLYDIPNSFEWFYEPQFTEFFWSVADDGTTTVSIHHGAWGTEVLLARWFYWGATPYISPGPDGIMETADDVNNYLDSTTRRGWWDMELAWFEDLRFAGSLGASTMEFQLSSVMQYHFQHMASGGPDGLLNKVGDVPQWSWGPVLSDYANDWGDHLRSELDRYAGLDGAPWSADDPVYLHNTPGAQFYGLMKPYETVPLTWDIKAGETWSFRFPSGNVVYYDPNLTPRGANPTLAQFVPLFAPLNLDSLFPSTLGTWDPATLTWTVAGPVTTGGPDGSPGPDRRPGTADDRYAMASYPAIFLGPTARIAVTVTGQWTQLYVGQTMDVTITAKAGGVALPGAAVAATLPGGTFTTPATGTTDANGMFKTTVRPNAGTGGTTITYSASVSKAGYTSGSGTFPISVLTNPLSLSVSVTSKTTRMMSLETATIRVRLSTTGGVGVTQGLLTATSTPAGVFSPVAELGAGNYSFGWTSPTVTGTTSALIRVSAKVGGYASPLPSSYAITVDPNKTGTPTQLTTLFSLGLPERTALRSGESILVRLYLYTIEGYPVAGATVTVTAVGGGTLTIVVDELNGLYTFRYTAPTVTGDTAVLLRAAFSKFGYRSGLRSIGLTVSP